MSQKEASTKRSDPSLYKGKSQMQPRCRGCQPPLFRYHRTRLLIDNPKSPSEEDNACTVFFVTL